MRKKNEVSVAHHCGLNHWGTIIKKELGFAEVKTEMPAGTDPDMFLGSMIIDEFRNGGLKIHMRSSAQKITLFHQDGVECKKNIIHAAVFLSEVLSTEKLSQQGTALFYRHGKNIRKSVFQEGTA